MKISRIMVCFHFNIESCSNYLISRTQLLTTQTRLPTCIKFFKQETYVKSRARNASLILPVIKAHYGEKTFQFFFIKLFNSFGKKISFLIMSFLYLIRE